MHQPSAEPRPSLYHRYRVHAPWLPSRGGRQGRKPVVIVGAGPAGLVTALELARHDVPVVVLEAERQVCEGSRAIVFTRRSLEILQQVGIADRVAEASLPWRVGKSWFRGEEVFRMEVAADDDDRFAPLNNLQQQTLEDFLVDACTANPLIDLRWGNRVRVFSQRGDSVRAEVDTPEGPYTIEADWLVAADGGRSSIRAGLDLPLEGTAYEGRFVIADIQADLPLPTERLAFFDPPCNPGNTVLVHREPHGIWRIDYQLAPEQSAEAALVPAALSSQIDAVLALIGYPGLPWQLDWASVYSARALTLDDYVRGRILFVGDAAHLLPIFGVRGANTAFQDAQALGWQLAQVCRGAAGPALLANYSAERVGAAREIIDEAGRSTRFMTPPSAGYREVRDAALALALTEPFVRPLLHWRTSRAHAYPDSALNAVDDDDGRFTSGPADGDVATNVRLGPDLFLLDHLGAGYDLLWFGGGPSLPPAVIAAIDAARARRMPLRVVTIGATGPVRGADLALPDPDGRCRARYGITGDAAAYLLRPDQHVCARWQQLDGERLEAALARALPSATSPSADAAAANARAPATGATPTTPLEAAFEGLALALDRVGPDGAVPFLARLALLSADAVDDRAKFAGLIATALQSGEQAPTRGPGPGPVAGE